MFVFSNDAGPTHDLLLLIDPGTPCTEHGSDLLGTWIAQIAEAVYPTAAYNAAPHIIACAPVNTRYAAIIHQHGCNVNARLEHSEFTRQQLIVAVESPAPPPIFAAKSFAIAVKESIPPVKLNAIGVSAVTALFAQEMWTKLVTEVLTWRSEPAWLSTPQNTSVSVDATDKFGWVRSPAAIPTEPDKHDDLSSTFESF